MDNENKITSSQTAADEKSIQRGYNKNYTVTDEYRNSLPDCQNAASDEIQGANVPILQVGISNFRLPLNFLTRENETVSLETSVTGTVSHAADTKGINMSRIIRTFYAFKERIFTLELLEEILLRYKEDHGSSRAHLKLSFSYPLLQKSLRSNLEGYQYYAVVFESILDDLDRCRKIIHFDYVYSSTCPCSTELSEHARETRQTFAIPHSQRSKARISAEIRPGYQVSIEDLNLHCLNALQTESQVMVKREDEQAFAELNGSHVKFVEDAARLLYEQLDEDERIVDFQIACAHLESLHSHDAVSVINKGVNGGFKSEIDDFKSLIC